MTAPGPGRPNTPIAGLVELALTAPTFSQLIDRTAERPAELSLVGPARARLFVAGALARQGPLLVVTATGREADDLTTELKGVFGDAAAMFPSWETLPHERLSPGVDTVGTRLMMLRRLAHPNDTRLGPRLQVVVTSVRSLLQPMSPQLGLVEPVTFSVGQEVDFERIIARLVELAYTRVDMVGRRGEFAVRGGILDIFAPVAEHPVRVEFWGDEITEMRMFSVADQRSIPGIGVDVLVAVACRELLLTDDVRARAAALAAAHPTDEGAITGSVSDMLAKLAEGIPVDGMEALLPLLRPGDHVLLTDQLAAGTPVLLCDPEKVRTRAADLIKTGREFLEASWSVAAMGGDSAPIDIEQLGGSGFVELDDVHAAALRSGHPWWTLSQLSDESAVELDIRAAPSARGGQSAFGDIEAIFAMLRAHVSTGGYAAVVAPGTGTAHRVVERLAESDTAAVMLEPGEAPRAGVVGVLKGPLHDGVVRGGRQAGGDHRDRSDRQPGDAWRRQAAGGQAAQHRRPAGAGSGRPGGARPARHRAVRRDGGTDRRRGPPRIPGAGICVGQARRWTDKLYVPMDSLDQLSRYVGGQAPALSKLGGSDWANTKTKARRAVREIAGELVALYAKRQASAGHAFGPDTPWQAEMEDAFGFTETVDQLTAITEVKADMEKPVPMDRVICGDVGYGKTEIAVRAAFKAVQDGKQVAVLVPTTLLADQHLETFRERMAGFPVVVKGLSRFTDGAESRAVIDGMADGSVDIVIGTHRLLQTGGALEGSGPGRGRRGAAVRRRAQGAHQVVAHPRRRADHERHPDPAHPRDEPRRHPRDVDDPDAARGPLPGADLRGANDDKQVAAALRRELLREGQAFYVHNRVSSIDSAAARLRELVPEAKVVVAHGQMPEDRLERTVQGFWNREYDILVCTTIVETGLDISNANTLIVERADTFGLSQLHQLRGRVGRSRERGYAYFLYPPHAPLTETAYDRLATIAQNNELGAGMAVALKDLEIRGAGNVLGVEQSGHVAGVGFDLYVRLVGEAVEAYRLAADGQTVTTPEEPKDVRIDLPVDAHLPPDYIASDRLRLEGYRRLAAAGTD